MPFTAAASPICSAVSPPTSSAPSSVAVDGDARARERVAQLGRAGRADANEILRGLAQELLDAQVGDQPAAPDHDQMLGGQRHLAHQVRGEEHRAALGGELLEQVADPLDPLGVEAVGRLVEDQDLRVGEQRRGDPEPLAHAERELPDALAGDLLQADAVDHLVDAPARDPVGLRQREQVVVGRSAGVDGARLEQRADLVQRRRVVAVALPVHGHRPGGRAVEPEDQPHRRRLPRPVRAEEPGDDPRLAR